MTPEPGTEAVPVRVLVDSEPASGAWNMAVDAVLLESAVASGACTLRWYQWKKPTLSLGYFQSADEPVLDGRFAEIPKVRRLSGGGAILHDRELTYSCAVSSRHPFVRRPAALYEVIHSAIRNVLNDFGIPVEFRGTSSAERDADFLCFSRGDRNDLVLGRHKVLGSAQRRRRGAVLQHGSLIWERSPVAPEFPGICDLVDGPPPCGELSSKILESTSSAIGAARVQWEMLTDQERHRAQQIEESIWL